MPNIKSQKDRVRQAKKEEARNKSAKSNLKTVVKKAETEVKSGASDADASVKKAIATVGHAASKRVIKKNTAARRMSRVMRAKKAQ